MGRYFGNIDWITFILVFGISIFGLFVLLTIDQAIFFQQLIFFVIGLGLAVIISRIDQTLLWWLGPLFYIVSVLFIILTYFAPEIRGAHRWIFIGSVQLQPSELVKPLLIVGFARLMTTYSPRILRYIPMHILLFLVVFLLIYKQPDLGTAIIFGVLWIGMMLAGGLQLRLLVLSIFITSITLPFLWNTLAPYQKDRISAFTNPDYDPHGVGYNALQAVITVGSGELFGRGLGRGTQSHLKFLPEYHTDFIFATLAEEFGFIGGMTLLALYFFLLWKILSPLLNGGVTDAFSYIALAGIFCMIFGQVFVNIGMNMGIVPVTGITLPFISYGGSSMLSTMASMGLLWTFTQRENSLAKVA